MRTLIALRGVANCGKSVTIKKAYHLLKEAYPRASVEELFVGADITIIMTIKGTNLGIESQGDPNSRLSKSLKRFVELGCKVIICATRTSGLTYEAVSNLASQYMITWLDKLKTPTVQEQEAANEVVAKEIFEEAQSAINA